jgi:tetratricopeptide (TPR) repeat protein
VTGGLDPDRRVLEDRVDHARRDLEELAAQVEEGEIDHETAARLESRYRLELAEADEALAALSEDGGASRRDRRAEKRTAASSVAVAADGAGGSPARLPTRGLVGLGAAAVVLTVLIVIIGSGGDDEPASAPATGTDPTVAVDPGQDPLAQMEAAVAANPEVNGMRLALAGLYFDRGEYLPAMEHYLAVLDNEPTQEEEALSLARVGWMAYVSGQPETAAAYLSSAVQLDPAYGEAKLFYGVVLLYGLEDPAGAIPVLEDVLALADLPASIRPDVENMLAEAREWEGGR